jgi:hypothetical protein
MKKKPAVISIFVGNSNTPKAVVVSDALFRGLYKLQPKLIEMPELY